MIKYICDVCKVDVRKADDLHDMKYRFRVDGLKQVCSACLKQVESLHSELQKAADSVVVESVKSALRSWAAAGRVENEPESEDALLHRIQRKMADDQVVVATPKRRWWKFWRRHAESS